MAGLEGWPVLYDFFSKELFGRDLKNQPVLMDNWFSEGSV
jgi:hypothetical protein